MHSLTREEDCDLYKCHRGTFSQPPPVLYQRDKTESLRCFLESLVPDLGSSRAAVTFLSDAQKKNMGFLGGPLVPYCSFVEESSVAN